MARIRTPTADTPSGEIAQAVRAEMARRGVTQEALAEQLGWTQRKISYRLTGTSSFRADEIVAVAAALAVPVTVLLPATEPAGGAR
jgi:transcriptional regulator with XRE-family HTH domain